MKRYRGSISIYFTFSIVIIISVIMSVTEIARMNCQKLYLQIASDTALDSMASLYYRDLYEYYNLYGVEYKTIDMLKTEYLSYMEPYFTDGDGNINNWYIATIDENRINLDIKNLTENTYFEKEILEYMKFKLLGKVVKFLGRDIEIKEEIDFEKMKDSALDVFDKVDKSSIYNEIHEKYFNFEKDIKTLENYAKKIEDYVDKVNIRLNSVKTMSTSGSISNANSVLSKMEKLDSEITILKAALTNYRNKMREFREKVLKSKESYENDKVTGKYDFDENQCAFIESEFEQFVSYVDENSEMNTLIEIGFENCNNMKIVVANDENEVRAFVDMLNSIEEQIESEERSEDKDSDYIRELKDERKELRDEFSDFLRDLKETYRDYKMEKINLVVSTENHDEEMNLLDKIVGFKNGLLINMVLDSDRISEIENLDTDIRDFDISSGSAAVSIDKIIFGEYELDKFNYYMKDLNGEFTASESKNLEVERLIAGKKSDLENIKSVINKILLIRIAMDVLYIYKDSTKRTIVRNFTNGLFAGFSPLLAEAMFLVVLTAWGTAQAVADVKKILKNKRVSFMHTDNTWTVSIDNLLEFASGTVGIDDETDDTGISLNYKDYLRILLLITRQTDINSRMAGMIEKNLKVRQSEFDFTKLIYAFDVNNTFFGKHFFTNFIFVEAKDVTLFDEYKVNINSYRSFYND